MYIQITVDLHKYGQSPIELRLSDHHSIKKLVDIAWQTVNLETKPREGYWIRVQNKERVFTGYSTLQECGITTGDSVEIM